MQSFGISEEFKGPVENSEPDACGIVRYWTESISPHYGGRMVIT